MNTRNKQKKREKQSIERKNNSDSEEIAVSSITSRLRKWEKHQKKGYDPNEMRITDIIECWAGEPGPAIGLVGIPFDSAVLGRKGAKEGPKKIRDSIRYFKAYDWQLDFWFGDQRIYDFGDIITDEQSVAAAHETIGEILCKITKKNFTPIIFGGDHSITYANVKGIKEALPDTKLGLINLDAHLDVREVIDGRISSGTPFRRILDNSLVAGENFVEIGIRNFTNAKVYREYAEQKGTTIFTMNDIQKQGLQTIIDKTIEIIMKDTDGFFISVDMDGLDQIYAPGVSAPTPNGLTPQQVLEIIHQTVLAHPPVGMDILELNPLYDTADTTAINAANFAVQFISSFLWRNREKNKTD
jgi:formimidoylglutamase